MLYDQGEVTTPAVTGHGEAAGGQESDHLIVCCSLDRQEGVETRDEVRGHGPVDRPHLLPDKVRGEGQEAQWCGQVIV